MAPFFKVGIVVSGAKFHAMFRGIPHETYQLAAQHGAYQLRDGKPAVRYGDTKATSSIMYIDMYFRDLHDMHDFTHGTSKIHHFPDTICEEAPDFIPTFEYENSECTLLESQMTPISGDELEKLENIIPKGFSTWQTIEDPTTIGIPYECRIIPKWMSPEEDPNNFLATSHRS